jgi:uncharacterized protein YndB with AHSA1/START domain
MSGAPDDRVIRLSRYLTAPVERVWQAWTDPAILPRWFGPAGFTCVTQEIDLRVGGQWLFTMEGMGMTFPNRHRWTELAPHGRIAFLLDGGAGDPDPKAVVVTLTPEGMGTRLVQEMTFASVDSVAAARAYRAEEMGMQTLAKLAAVVEG